MSVIILFSLFFGLLVMGAPIAIALGASTFIALVGFTPISAIEISS